MCKLIVSMNVTLDGYMSGPDCELDWHFTRWSADMGERLTMELSKTSALLLGRVTYQAMARYWPARAIDRSSARADIPFALLVNEHQKIVYTNTLQTAGWKNSDILSGNLKPAISSVKQSKEFDKNIIVYGSGKLVAALCRFDLVDEYQLWIHPVIIGKGKRLFHPMDTQSDFRLKETTRFESGVALLTFTRE
jgi:dihydrofolate reductase